MDEFIVLGILAFIVAFILPIYLFFSHLGLKKKVAALEANIRQAPDVATQTEASPKETRTPWQLSQIKSAPIETPEEFVAEEVNTLASPPKSFVFKRDLITKTVTWLQTNWFFAVAAISMALAGVFLVQYGVENGLLSPERRVLGAIILGVILIGAGEYIRRKLGSDEDGAFAFLPSAFAGAGLVSLFAGVLSARMLYGLIGPEMALIGLSMTGVIAIVLGWFYGPLLAIVGVFGALAAPFLVGGDGGATYWLYLYFAGIAGVALAIDSFKRWAWLSTLGLIGAFGAATFLYLGSNTHSGSGHPEFFILFGLITTALATSIPTRKLIPTHDGTMISQLLTRLRKTKRVPFPDFPTRLAAGAFLVSSIMIGVVYLGNWGNIWVSLAGLGALFLMAVFWMRGAPALGDMAFVPPSFMLVILAIEGADYRPLKREWIEGADIPVLDYPPAILFIIMAAGLVVSLIFAWRSWNSSQFRLTNTIFAAAIAPDVAAVFTAFWNPEFVLGKANWALYLAVVAIAMTLLAQRFSKKDGEDRMRPALFALSAIAMLNFMAFTLLGSVALTLSLAVLVVAAAWMGGKFNLPLLDRYVQVGVLTATWRLVVSPGVEWGIRGALWEVVLAFAGVIALLIAAYVVKRKDVRPGVVVMLESAIWSLSGVFFTIMLFRYFESINSPSALLAVSLIGLIWLISAANQLYRIRPNASLRRTRIVLTSIYAMMGGFMLIFAVFGLNPLNGLFENARIKGPMIFDSIFASYALPGLLLMFVALRFKHVHLRLRKILGGLGALLIAYYIGLEIRRFWHGDYISGSITYSGELYSYTVAMMVVVIALFALAFVRQSATLRKLALVGVGLTVAKVYMVDMWGLDRLLLVVSFLALGLLLAVLAWVNRILQKNEASAKLAE